MVSLSAFFYFVLPVIVVVILCLFLNFLVLFPVLTSTVSAFATWPSLDSDLDIDQMSTS